MNKTQKIIIKEAIGLGFALPTELSIISDYLLPAIKESGFLILFESIGKLILFIFNILLIYASYKWVIDISQNIERTERLMYYDKEKFKKFLIKIFATFIITFSLALILKNYLGI